MRRIMHHWIVA